MENKYSKDDLIRVAIYCWNIASNPKHGKTYNVNEIVEDYIERINLGENKSFCKIYNGYFIIAMNKTDYDYKVRKINIGDTKGFYHISNLPIEVLKQAVNYEEQ